MLKRLTIFAVAAAFAATPLPSLAQGKKDSVVMGMGLEPPGLDPHQRSRLRRSPRSRSTTSMRR